MKEYEDLDAYDDDSVHDMEVDYDFHINTGTLPDEFEDTDLDEASEVVVYAKLPRSFQIPTPVGSYAPDWAIAIQKGNIKHIFFIAETKGSLQSMQLNAIENAKIDCCTQLFNEMSTESVRYHKVTCYQDLIDAMTSTK